jgi:hypothetical protein
MVNSTSFVVKDVLNVTKKQEKNPAAKNWLL